jgi:hypothetical protein
MEVNQIHPPERMTRRTFCVTLGVVTSIVNWGCGTRTSSLAGQIQWVHYPGTGTYRSTEGPLNGVFGAAFLLLEEEYESLGYDGPPKGFPKTVKEALDWHRQMPEVWWNLPSIPYEWWGRQSGTEPTEVTLPLDVPVHLLRAHLDSVGRFEFADLPRGRHTLFIRWGKSPDPQDNISGPFEVLIDEPGRIERVFPVNAFDLISTESVFQK